MAKRKQAVVPEVVNSVRDSEGPAVIQHDDANFQAVSAKALQEYTGQAAYRDNYRNLDGKVSGRPGLVPGDYYSFRPGEAPPGSYQELIVECEQAYRKIGLIHNVIDLMGDFTCHGIRVSCPNKKEEAVYRKWFNKVEGVERSERWANNFYRVGNVVVRRLTAKSTIRVKRYYNKTSATPDMEVDLEEKKEIEIPNQYVFLNPSTVVVLGGQLAAFVGKPVYGIVLSTTIKRLIKSPKDEIEKALVAALPEDIKKAAETNKPYPLPVDKTIVYHYKKDDWNVWGTPMLESILSNIKQLVKLNLADMAALDGVISNIRIFKLGSLETQPPISPTPAAAQRLAEILQNHVGGGTIDIVWDAAIDLLESKTALHQFLGEEKYKPVMNAIYSGLGIPPVVTGTFGAPGTTNNFISLKTLIQRLEYGRKMLSDFWQNELEIVRKTLNLKHKATVEFDNLLSDDVTERKLWFDMYDRGLVSDEMMRYVLKSDNELEEARLKRENRERKNGRREAKAGPYYDAQFEVALRKIALQQGYIGPKQAGVEVKDIPEETPMQVEVKLEKEKIRKTPKTSLKPTRKKQSAPNGRPKNAKDKQKRKTKTFKPRTRAALEIWATQAQQAINETLSDHFLSVYGHKNVRQFTETQFEEAEKIKFGVLSNIVPITSVTPEVVSAALQNTVSFPIKRIYESLKSGIELDLQRKLTVDELRKLQVIAYVNHYAI